MLKDLFEQEDRFFEFAHSYIRDSMATFQADERAFFLHQALDCYIKAHADFQAKVRIFIASGTTALINKIALHTGNRGAAYFGTRTKCAGAGTGW